MIAHTRSPSGSTPSSIPIRIPAAASFVAPVAPDPSPICSSSSNRGTQSTARPCARPSALLGGLSASYSSSTTCISTIGATRVADELLLRSCRRGPAHLPPGGGGIGCFGNGRVVISPSWTRCSEVGCSPSCKSSEALPHAAGRRCVTEACGSILCRERLVRTAPLVFLAELGRRADVDRRSVGGGLGTDRGMKATVWLRGSVRLVVRETWMSTRMRELASSAGTSAVTWVVLAASAASRHSAAFFSIASMRCEVACWRRRRATIVASAHMQMRATKMLKAVTADESAAPSVR